jgi:hypothetical protein
VVEGNVAILGFEDHGVGGKGGDGIAGGEDSGKENLLHDEYLHCVM